MHSQPFLPVSQPLPSSGPAEFIPVPNEVPSQPFAHPTVSSEGPMQQHVAFSHPQDFNGITGMVPTIMETTQPGSREGIVQNLQHAGYAVQQPQISGPEESTQFFSHDIFHPGFHMTGDFPGAFGEIPPDMPESFAAYNIPIPSIEGTQLTLQALPSSASLAPSVASTYSHQSTFTDESNAAITAATSSSPCDPAECSGLESNGGSSHSEHWEAPNPVFHHGNPSAPALLPSGEITETPTDSKSGPLELSSDAFARRNSSTSGLADSMNAVDITVQNGDSDFKAPNPPSSLAARRQRPRPAALGAASLRSASYSVGMPASPGANQNLAAPDQALRRIRSSGVTNPSRVQKPGSSSGQRSPMNLAFTDAAASPKWGRLSSSSYGSTFVTSPGIASSIAPPTPNTPSEFNHFPSWQTPGAKVYGPSGEVININGVATCIPEGVSGPGLMTFSSPPTTPLDQDQAAQYRSYLQLQQQTMYRDTPPQSAPASQQTFSQTSLPPAQPMPPTLSINGDKIGHFRRPSLPDGPNAFPVGGEQWPAVPLFTTTGELALNGPIQPTANGMEETQESLSRVQFSNPFSSSPGHMSVIKPDFSVHHYTPPDGSGVNGGMQRHESAPKIYHFSNQGPRDFKGQC